tara:strand:- start:3287 stop:3538 length:252 start_codon:yes stop_codon:yes gene_type:complete
MVSGFVGQNRQWNKNTEHLVQVFLLLDNRRKWNFSLLGYLKKRQKDKINFKIKNKDNSLPFLIFLFYFCLFFIFVSFYFLSAS